MAAPASTRRLSSINLVTGEELRHSAYQMRVYDHLCGVSGKHFEAFPGTASASMPAEPF